MIYNASIHETSLWDGREESLHAYLHVSIQFDEDYIVIPPMCSHAQIWPNSHFHINECRIGVEIVDIEDEGIVDIEDEAKFT